MISRIILAFLNVYHCLLQRTGRQYENFGSDVLYDAGHYRHALHYCSCWVRNLCVFRVVK